MFTIQSVKKRALFIFRFVTAILSGLCCCCKRRKSIGELPYTIVHGSPQTHWKSGEEKWGSWSNTPFVASVEEKIMEYHRKKIQSEAVGEERVEVDYFNDMQPKVTQTPRAFINNDMQSQNRNLFAMATDHLPISHLGELGNLEDTVTYDEAENWDNQLDIEEDIDNALREQRAKERQERRLARQLEHAKRYERRKE